MGTTKRKKRDSSAHQLEDALELHERRGDPPPQLQPALPGTQRDSLERLAMDLVRVAVQARAKQPEVRREALELGKLWAADVERECDARLAQLDTAEAPADEESTAQAVLQRLAAQFSRSAGVVALLLFAACTSPDDAGAPDCAPHAMVDAAAPDAGELDAGELDAGATVDAGAPDGAPWPVCYDLNCESSAECPRGSECVDRSWCCVPGGGAA